MNESLSSDDAITGLEDGRWPQRRLGMSAFGRMGRFGNQLFQYAFLRICAEQGGAVVECPEWVGTKLFGHRDPPVSDLLPPAIEAISNKHSIFAEAPALTTYIERLHAQPVTSVGPDALATGASNLDLYGFFQYHTRHYLPHQHRFRSLFQPVDELRHKLDAALKPLWNSNRPLVGVHVRRGDYVTEPRVGFTMPFPADWYASWLSQNWAAELEEPLVFVCSDELHRVLPAFANHETITVNDLDADLVAELTGSRLGFYLDFYILTQCDALVISNSTFSFAAAMLNQRATRFARPIWDLQQRFADFDPWDAVPLLWPHGDDSTFFQGTSEVLRLAHQTGGPAGFLKCLMLYLPFSHLRELALRSYLALAGRGVVR